MDDGGSTQAIGSMECTALVFNVGADVEGDRYPLAKQAMPDLAGAVEVCLPATGDARRISSEATARHLGSCFGNEQPKASLPTTVVVLGELAALHT